MTFLAWSFLKLGALAVLFAELVARIGTGVLALIERRQLSAAERAGGGFLIGLVALGTAYLGLAATGLFYPSVMVAVLAGLAAAGPAWRTSIVVPGMRGWALAAGLMGAALVGLALVPVVVQWVLPDLELDCWIYHFAVPWQYLESHKMILGHVPVAFHHSLPVDLTFALGMALGEDRLARTVMLLCFAAGTAAWASSGRTGAAVWLGAILALSTGWSEWLMTRGKNDLAAAGMLVAGAGLASRGVWGAAGVLAGCGLAAKPVYAPLVLCLGLVWPPPRRRWGWTAAALALPSLPWAAKEWLASGHPTLAIIVPNVMPAYDWGELNRRSFASYCAGVWPADTMKLALLPGTTLRHLYSEYLVLSLLAPGVLLFASWRSRAAVAACLASQVMMVGLGHMPRYLLAAAWVMALVTGVESGRLGPALLAPWARRWGIGLVAAAIMGQIIAGTVAWKMPWRELSERGAGYAAHRLGRIGEAGGWIASRRLPRTALVGEMRTYRIPGRVVYGGMQGETPLVWEAVKASSNEDRLRVKIRQWGASYLLYNYAGYACQDWMAFTNMPFAWDDRMLALYRSYAKGYLERVVCTEGNDYDSGGFCLFRIRTRPVAPRPSDIWFLPGTESLYGIATMQDRHLHYPEMLEAGRSVLARLPDVGQAWNFVGHAYALLGDGKQAYAHLRRFADAGMVDLHNFPDLAAAAFLVGRLDVAEKALVFSLPRYPHKLGDIRLNLALIYMTRGYAALARGRVREATALAAEAEREFDLFPSGTNLEEDARRKRGALVDLKARIAAASGRAPMGR